MSSRSPVYWLREVSSHDFQILSAWSVAFTIFTSMLVTTLTIYIPHYCIRAASADAMSSASRGSPYTDFEYLPIDLSSMSLSYLDPNAIDKNASRNQPCGFIEMVRQRSHGKFSRCSDDLNLRNHHPDDYMRTCNYPYADEKLKRIRFEHRLLVLVRDSGSLVATVVGFHRSIITSIVVHMGAATKIPAKACSFLNETGLLQTRSSRLICL